MECRIKEELVSSSCVQFLNFEKISEDFKALRSSSQLRCVECGSGSRLWAADYPESMSLAISIRRRAIVESKASGGKLSKNFWAHDAKSNEKKRILFASTIPRYQRPGVGHLSGKRSEVSEGDAKRSEPFRKCRRTDALEAKQSKNKSIQMKNKSRMIYINKQEYALRHRTVCKKGRMKPTEFRPRL